MMKRKRIIVFTLWTCLSVLWIQATEYPAYLYEEWRKTAFPAGDITLQTNPQPLLWPSVKHWEKRNVTYNVYLSQDPGFSKGKTIQSLNQRYAFYNPHRKLNPGKWYWKYEVVSVDKGIEAMRGVYSFIVEKATDGLVTPTFNELWKRVSTSHPRILNYNRKLADIRHDAPSHPLYNVMMDKAYKAIDAAIYRGPISDKDPSKAKALTFVVNKEIGYFWDLLHGYVLSKDERMMQAMLDRMEILFTWPTDDLAGSHLLGLLSMSYDVLYDSLPEDAKQRILQIVDKRLQIGLKAWPGVIEARHVENHFWQAVIAGNFKAALATAHHLESAKQMLAYTYELYVARFPNLGTPEGGWAEGEGYYSVNQSSILDMSLLMKRLLDIDFYEMSWFDNLTDYFTYFSPVAAPVSGFGDMHERVSNGSQKGKSEMLILSQEKHNNEALYRLYSSLKPIDSFYKETGNDKDETYFISQLSTVEAWYQLVNNVYVDFSDAKEPKNKPHDKVFYGVGIGALHSNVFRPEHDATVFFRSSPFGSKGHMHANHNSFNISRKGERIFYSTGYYTSFSDPHALSSYRHTRAHNSILVNGCGQAFGHEGYGWIKGHREGKHISYICGEAAPAYKKTVDKQFLDMCRDNGIEQTVEHGFADSDVKKFERHIAFVRPDVVVIYDVLEATKQVEWSLLLHAYNSFDTTPDGALQVTTRRSCAHAEVFSNQELTCKFTEKFASPAIDFKKKYKNGVPHQYHASYTNTDKCDSMRFLTIISMSDVDKVPYIAKRIDDVTWQVGDVTITAILDTTEPAQATVTYAGETMNFDANASLPIGNYVR